MKKSVINLSSSFLCYGNVVGKKEFEGPLGSYFDFNSDDGYFGMNTWEKAESEMQRLAFNIALKKKGLGFDAIGALFAGDLLNQCVGSAYGLAGCMIPYFGIYGACSTSAEGIILSSILTTHGIYERCAAVTSSHFCSAERQFRTPLEYGGQRTPTSQWTVTGSGAFVIGSQGAGSVKICAACPGRVIDAGINDPNNMGAAMAPAAADTLCRYFRETGEDPKDYDMILTGDLGYEGSAILCELMSVEGYKIQGIQRDCGVLIFDRDRQDTHAGGSGCGCSAAVLSAYILPMMEKKNLKKILYMATGALMSPDSVKQGQSIPSIGHLLRFEV